MQNSLQANIGAGSRTLKDGVQKAAAHWRGGHAVETMTA